MKINESDTIDYPVKSACGIIVDDDTRCLCEYETFDCDLFENNITEVCLVGATELKSIEHIVILAYEQFDFTGNANLESLVLCSFDPVNEAERFRFKVAWFLEKGAIKTNLMALGSESMWHWHFHKCRVNGVNRVW
jgi:hypothetical protein